MSAGFLELNLAALKHALPGLAEFMFSAEFAKSAESIASAGTRLVGKIGPKGFVSAELKGVLLHSLYDPAGEAKRIISALDPEADSIVFIGFGLGYGPEAAMELRPEATLVIAEPDPALFYEALGLRDLRALFSGAKLVFAPGNDPEGLHAAIDGINSSNPAQVRIRALYEAKPEIYEALSRRVEQCRAKERINDNTIERFGKLWVRNLARNAMELGRRRGIAALSGLFKDIPSLVLAAGPSLDLVLPSLPELSKRFIVICVDTALRASLRVGVQPDFVVVVDPQYWNSRHLDWTYSPESLLVTEAATNPEVFRASFRDSLLCASLYPLGSWLEREIDETKGKLGAGGSVATTAWDLASLLGSKDVLIAGLDLGFPGGKTHAAGSYFELRSLVRSSRLEPTETASFQAMHGAAPFLVDSNSGSSVFTDSRMILYAWWFEKRLAESGSPHTRNLESRGVKIKSMDFVGLDEALAFPIRRTEIDARLRAAPTGRISKEAQIREALIGLIAQLKKIESAAQRGLSALEGAERALARSDSKRLKAELSTMAKVDASILDTKARELLGFLLKKMAKGLGKAQDMAGSLAQSRDMYQSLIEATKNHLEYLKSEE